MSDPLILVLGGCFLLSLLSTMAIDRWRRRRERGIWPILLWAIAPFVVIGGAAFGCSAFVSEAAGNAGACMPFGGLLMVLPLLYWPVWLVGMGVGLVLGRLFAAR